MMWRGNYDEEKTQITTYRMGGGGVTNKKCHYIAVIGRKLNILVTFLVLDNKPQNC